MQIRFLKKNKKGLTLPIAIVISLIMAILAMGLLFIAISSTSSTTATVNGRQAYLNLVSALEYAKAYYEDVEWATMGTLSNPTTGERSEYFVMNDAVGGTAEEGATVGDASIIDGKMTYIYAVYTPATDSQRAMFRLYAYANYSDTFGNGGKTVHLTASYPIGGGDIPWIDYPDHGGSGASSNQTDTIRLNLKQPVDLNWDICYYIWTYKDPNGAYKDATGKNIGISYGYTPDVHKLNAAESLGASGQAEEPNGPWTRSNPDGTKGANGLMIQQGNGWFAGDYSINRDRVNYFNIIFAQKGSLLEEKGIYNTQTNEIFHLWYLDPDDKNIYFEFLNNLKSESGVNYYTKYYQGTHWNGLDGLDDTIVVYVKNSKTAIHFRAIGDNDTEVTNTLGASAVPEITSISGIDTSERSYLSNSGTKQNSGITMTYEGCGWWVANVETKSRFDISISYRGQTYSLSGVRPHSDTSTPDATYDSWLVLDQRLDLTSGTYEKYLTAHQTENSALSQLGVSSTSYVTIHAKDYNPDTNATPKLSYMNVLLDSSAGRTRLYQKIIEVSSLNASDYEDFTEVASELSGAITVYNDAGFISGQTGTTNAEKVAAADLAYDGIITRLNDKVANLVPATVDADTLTRLQAKINEADAIAADPSKYDTDYFVLFIADDGAYKAAKEVMNNAKSTASVTVRKSIAIAAYDALVAAVQEIKDHELDRDTLRLLINDAIPYQTNNGYDQLARQNLTTAIVNAQNALIVASQTQLALDTQVGLLTSALNTVINSPVSTLDTEAFDNAVRAAQDKLDAIAVEGNNRNYTDDTKANLEAVKQHALDVKADTNTTQEQLNEQTALVEAATRRFDVIRPVDTNADLSANNTIRLWIQQAGTAAYQVNAITATGASSVTTSDSLVDVPFTNLHYLDINKTMIEKVSISFIDNATGNITATSSEFALAGISDNNILLDISATNAVTQKKLISVYVPSLDADGNVVGTLTAQLSSQANGEYLIAQYVGSSVTTYGYNVLRFAEGTGSLNLQTEVSAGDTYVYPGLNLSAGEYVLRFERDTTYHTGSLTAINVNDIYPKPVTTPPTTPGAGGISTKISNYNVEQLATVTTTEEIEETFEIDVPDGQSCIILNAENITDTPYIHAWNSEGSITTWGSLPPMLKYKAGSTQPAYQYIYYYLVDETVESVLITNASSGSGSVIKVTDDINLGAGGSHYKYYSISKLGSNIVTNVTNGTPSFRVTTLVTQTMVEQDLPMAYVGGNRIRIKNKSYYDTYASLRYENGGIKYVPKHNQYGSGHDINENWLYGGEARDLSQYRVGDSQLLAYYDWYEFKIPVESTNTYTFEIEGLEPGSTTKTSQVKEAYGDVWVSLFNNQTSSGTGRYRNVEVITFDPEKNQIGSTLSLYIKMPTGTSSTWGNPVLVKAHGTDASTVNAPFTRLSRQTNIYKVDGISKNTPFLEISVDETTAAGTTTTHNYRTQLMGGDYILFNPAANGGLGQWEAFKADQTYLKDTCDQLLNMYYANYIVAEYNSNGELVNHETTGGTAYYKSEYLYSLISSSSSYNYFERANSGDPWKTSITKINSTGESTAYADYQSLSAILESYQALFDQMAAARSYIQVPLSNNNSEDNTSIHPTTVSDGRYPEYLRSGDNSRNYTSETLKALRKGLSEAEKAYINGSGSISDSLAALNRSLANLEVASEDAVTAVVYDAQNKIRQGHTFLIRYTLTNDVTATPVTTPMTDLNSQNYPGILLLQNDPTHDSVYNVQIIDRYMGTDTLLGSAKNEMQRGEMWIYADTAENGGWVKQEVDRRQLSTDEYVQSSASDAVEFRKRTGYKRMELKVMYDTRVQCLDAAVGTYTIKAGIYRDLPDPEYINLFTSDAKDYFTNPENCGLYTENGLTAGSAALDASTLGWHDGIYFKTGNNSTMQGNVNFEVRNGSFNVLPPTMYYNYTTNKGMNFRWSAKDPLYLRSSVKLYATEYRFAFVGEINAFRDGTIDTHFYLYNYDNTKDSVEVQFFTDVDVRYKDRTGLSKSFTIDAGKYRLHKASNAAGIKTDYVADFFDEDYWNSENVERIDVYGSSSVGITGRKLLNPSYSN